MNGIGVAFSGISHMTGRGKVVGVSGFCWVTKDTGTLGIIETAFDDGLPCVSRSFLVVTTATQCKHGATRENHTPLLKTR
jgi:hypothetical protein